MGRMTRTAVLLVLAASVAVVQGGNPQQGSLSTVIDGGFEGLRCKLPGWPGHPAPPCDPQFPEQCCPGTICAPDPFDPEHHSCQQMDSVTTSEHALTANVLASHVESVVTEAVQQLKMASLGLYLDRPIETVQTGDILTRAKKLLSKQKEDWHKGPLGKEKTTKKSDEDKKSSDHNVNHTPSSTTNLNEQFHSRGDQGSTRRPSSTPSPSLLRNPSDHSESHGDTNDDMRNLLRQTALQLLQADLQLRTASTVVTRSDILNRVSTALKRLQQGIDEEIMPSIVSSGPTTQPPSAPWGYQDDYWKRYVAELPSEIKPGERAPGVLGGACGKTTANDFGQCIGEDMACVGADITTPGICQFSKDYVQAYSRASAINTLRLAEEALTSLRAASIELLLVGSIAQSEGNLDGQTVSNSSMARISADPPSVTRSISLNKTLEAVEEARSPLAILLVLVVSTVVSYICCTRFGRRRSSYQSIETWGSRTH